MVTASAFVLLLLLPLLPQLSLLILSIISGLASARFSLLSHGAAQPDDALAMTFIDVTVVIFGVVLPLTTITCLAVVQRQSRTPAVVPMPSSRALEHLPSEPQTRSLNLNIEVMATVTTIIPGGGSARSGAMSTATTSVTASGSSATTSIARADGRPPRSRAPPPGPSESLVLDPCIGRQRLRRCAGTCSGKT